MLTEHEPRQTTEKALTIDIGDKRIRYSPQDWYTNRDIANAIGGNLPIVITQLHKVRKNDESIEFTTLGELNRKGKSAPIGNSQTIVYNETSFIKAVTALVSIKTNPLPRKIHSEPNMHKSPTRKDKKPKQPREDNPFFNPFSSANLNAKKLQETHKTPPKEILNMITPKQILAANSVIKALSHLVNGTLQEISHDIQELLQQAAIEHVKFPRFEDDPTENIMTKILDSDSPNRLNRFFRVSLDGMLYDLWDVMDTNERKLKKEEKKIIEICRQLKSKGYDKKRVIQEVFTHFRIPITSASGQQFPKDLVLFIVA